MYTVKQYFGKSDRYRQVAVMERGPLVEVPVSMLPVCAPTISGSVLFIEFLLILQPCIWKYFMSSNFMKNLT